MARSENLPVLPQAVSSVLKLADDPDSSPRDLEKVIERDPAITAKVLRVANSAYYGAVTVPTVGRAISFLGLSSIRSLIVSVAFQQMISGKSSTSSFDRTEYWKHSLAVGTASRIIAKMRMPTKAEELYCAGMMHDIGMLVLDRFMPDEFDSSLVISKQMNLPLHLVEQEKVMFDHAEVGGMLAQRWGLVPMMQHAIRFHHNPMDDGDYYESTCIVSAANSLAHQIGFTNSQGQRDHTIDEEVAAAIGLPVEQFDVIKDVVLQEVQRAQDAFKI